MIIEIINQINIGSEKTIIQLLSSSNIYNYESGSGKTRAETKFVKNIPKHIPELIKFAYF